MATKKILITGLGASATEEALDEALGHFGPVVGVSIIRDGDATRPVALVEMEIDAEEAAYLVLRVKDLLHGSEQICARIMNH